MQLPVLQGEMKRVELIQAPTWLSLKSENPPCQNVQTVRGYADLNRFARRDICTDLEQTMKEGGVERRLGRVPQEQAGMRVMNRLVSGGQSREQRPHRTDAVAKVIDGRRRLARKADRDRSIRPTVRRVKRLNRDSRQTRKRLRHPQSLTEKERSTRKRSVR